MNKEDVCALFMSFFIIIRLFFYLEIKIIMDITRVQNAMSGMQLYTFIPGKLGNIMHCYYRYIKYMEAGLMHTLFYNIIR